MYRSVLDPLISLGYAAAVTSRARLGVAVLNAPFYSPIVLAKQLTTIDRLSDGRLDTGLGLGWADEEFAATGAGQVRPRPADRGVHRLPAGHLGAGSGVASTARTTRSRRRGCSPSRSSSRRRSCSVAEPSGRLQRVGRYGDGWISASRHDPATIPATIATIKAAAVEADRDPDRLRFIIRAVIQLTEADLGEDRQVLHGSADQIRGRPGRSGRQRRDRGVPGPQFRSEVGSPAADPEKSMDYAHRVLEAFAPESPGCKR